MLSSFFTADVSAAAATAAIALASSATSLLMIANFVTTSCGADCSVSMECGGEAVALGDWVRDNVGERVLVIAWWGRVVAQWYHEGWQTLRLGPPHEKM